jgi:thioredoxin 1
VKVNTDLAQETALQFEIRSIPTLIFFKDGEPLFQFAGLVPKKVLDRELNTLLGEATA